MNTTAADYLARRGITLPPVLEELASWGVDAGSDGRLGVPWKGPDGRTLYSTRVSLNGAQPKYKHQPGPRPALWASPGAWKADPVGLTEGMFDALALAQIGLPAFASMTNSITPHAEEILARKGEVVVFPDADEPGQELVRQARQVAGWTTVRLARMPPGAKDANEVLVKLGEEELAAAWVGAEKLTRSWLSSWAPCQEWGAADSPPELLHRTDGQALLYVGKLIWLQGVPESGKTWLAAVACLEAIRAGKHVIYVDFEATRAAITDRFRALGATEEDLGRVIYVSPSEPMDTAARADVAFLMAMEPLVVVIDGITEAMGLHGMDPWRDAARFIHEVVTPFRSPSTVTTCIDHMAKSDKAGRFAYGDQHKLAASDLAITFEVIQPFARDRGGASSLRVAKDRPGYVRGFALNKEIAGTLHAFTTGDGVRIDVEPPAVHAEASVDGPSWTAQRVVAVLDTDAPGCTYAEIGDRLAEDGRGKPLKRNTIKDAIDELMNLKLADGIRTEGGEPSRFWRVESDRSN